MAIMKGTVLKNSGGLAGSSAMIKKHHGCQELWGWKPPARHHHLCDNWVTNERKEVKDDSVENGVVSRSSWRILFLLINGCQTL